jgi:hypothetical protein
MNQRNTYGWKTTAVIAAPPGWRVVFSGVDGEPGHTDPMPAWLLQEEWEVSSYDGALVEPTGDTRVVPSHLCHPMDGGHLEPVVDVSNHESTLAPGQGQPVETVTP